MLPEDSAADETKYALLARKLLEQTITPAEEAELVEWLGCTNRTEMAVAGTDNSELEMEQRLWTNIQQAAGSRRIRRMGQRRWLLRLSVAALLTSVIAGAYFISRTPAGHPKSPVPVLVNASKLPPIDSGKSRLTLANGAVILPDDAGNGVLAAQGSVRIMKTSAGRISIGGDATDRSKPAAYNTMSTPRGVQYQLELPDKSLVWLNAGTSLRFPSSFAGSERNVALTGEAYFEVTKNARQPFTVTVNNMTVTVLGTHFNINAYSDESDTRTTLLEGAVRLTKGNERILLKPGQLAAINNSSNRVTVSRADVEQAMAWKHGLFQFQASGIESIMRQLSKWYDVEVSYRGNLEGRTFSGMISRKSALTQVLRMLELSNEVHFEVQGKSVIVSP